MVPDLRDSSASVTKPSGQVVFSCIRDGAVAGVYAGAALIALFFVFDLLRLQPFATPASLSRVMLGQQVEASPGLVAALKLADIILLVRNITTYTMLHLAVFASLGIGAAILFEWLEVPKNVMTGALYGIVVGSTVFYGGLGIMAGDLLAAPDWLLVLLGNGVAGVIMVAHLVGKSGNGDRVVTKTASSR